MTTYSDLVTLLLTFFVLLFSMATIDNQKFEEIKKSLQSSFLHFSNGENFNKNTGEDMFSIIEKNNPQDSIERLNTNKKQKSSARTEEEILEEAKKMIVQRAENVKEEMKQAIEKMGLSDYVSVVREEHNVIFRIDSVVLFDLGKAEIKSSGKEILERFSVLLNEIDNEIIIQGHTDDLPINTLLFPTNWELSTKRATNVVLYLIEHCSLDPGKLTATGNGEHRPIKPNSSDENRQKNRRIDIVISGEYFTDRQPD